MESEVEGLKAAIWPTTGVNPTRVIRCRQCGQRNRVEIPVAVFSPERCRCGACHTPLFLQAADPLSGLSAHAYEHPLDRTTLQALQAVPGFSALLRWLLSNVTERSFRLTYASTGVQCGPDQFPELVTLLEQARSRLDVSYRPHLFLVESATMNAMTWGVEEPIMAVYSALLDQLEDREVQAILGHELGHLHADHSLYRVMANLLLHGGASLLTGPARLLTLPLTLALLKWYRCSELTADRAGLLSCGDLRASLFVLFKLAGGNRPGTLKRTQLSLPAFIRQARALEKQENSHWLDGILSALLSMDTTHPFAAWRVMQLLDWVENGNYLDILAGEYERQKVKTA